jgi:hypothetical protein
MPFNYLFLVFFAFLLLLPWAAAAAPKAVYLPIYSHVYHGNIDPKDGPNKILLSAMVSLRNTDPVHTLTITAIDYYDTAGKKIRGYLTKPMILAPMASAEQFIERVDVTGGAGANFIIVWDADPAASPPLFEAVHVHSIGSTSLSFITQGVAIKP